MKSVVLFLSCFLIGFVYSQEEIIVSNKVKTLQVGEVAAFVTLIPEANYDDVIKKWEKYIGQDTKEKVELIDGEYVISNKEYPKISAQPIQIYSYIKEYDRELLLVVAIQIGEGFVSRDFDEEVYIPAKKYVRDFAVACYQDQVADDLKGEEKELKKLNNQLSALQSKRESVLQEISYYERTIVNKKDEITLNQVDQSNKVIQIQAQKELILQLANAGEEQIDEAEKILKEMEKDFKKLQKQNESHFQAIDENESYIRQKEIELAKIENDIKLKQLEIDDQSYLVQKTTKKLGNIE